MNKIEFFLGVKHNIILQTIGKLSLMCNEIFLEMEKHVEWERKKGKDEKFQL